MGLYSNTFLVLEQKMSMEDYLDSIDETKRNKIIKDCKSKIDNVVKEADKILKELKLSNIATIEDIDIENIIEDYDDINYPMDYIPFISFKKIGEDQFIEYINDITKKLKSRISYKGLKIGDYDDFSLLLNISKEFFA